MVPALSVTTAYAVCVLLVLASATLSSLELARVPTGHLHLVFPSTQLEHKRAIWNGIHVGQVLLALFAGACFVAGETIGFRLGVIGLTGLVLMSYRLRSAGKDGADQLRMLILLALSICFALPSEWARRAPLYFLGCEVLIAYATAGTAKITSTQWRDGHTVSAILCSYAYGWPRVGRFLVRRPRLDKLASWSPMALMRAAHYPRTRCSTPRPAPPTTSPCACITTRR